MGQQQLLLLVLATVIVGIAIAVGILAFRENTVRSNYDALVQDVIRIASDAQAWKLKPAMFGGQDDALKTDTLDYTNATLHALGFQNLTGSGINACYENRNGKYAITVAGANGLTIEGGNLPNVNKVQATVTGVRDTSIELVADESIVGGSTADGTEVTTITITGCTF
jgi:hypothetical protein